MVVFAELQKFLQNHPVVCMTIIYALAFNKMAQKGIITSLWKVVFIQQKLVEIMLALVFLSRAGGSSAVEHLLSMHKAQGSMSSTAKILFSPMRYRVFEGKASS